MKKDIYQLDAFTTTPYCGNPAAVVPNATGLGEKEMLKIAKEMNLSETAFVFPGGEGYDFEVRFFTPSEEVDLCGHATIATFSLLKSLRLIDPDCTKLIQKTKAGHLQVEFLDDGIVLMRQTEPVNVHKELSLAKLTTAIGLDPKDVGIDHLMSTPEIWSTGLNDLILPVNSINSLRALSPNMNKLSDLSNKLDVVGVHAFAFDEDKNVWCRNFAPAFGIPEESATGTSNGALGACLHSKGYHTNGKLKFTAYQGYWMGRPSQIYVQIHGKDKPEVFVGGKAVITLEGRIII